MLRTIIILAEFCWLAGCGAERPVPGPRFQITPSSPFYAPIVLFAEDIEELADALSLSIIFEKRTDSVVADCQVTKTPLTLTRVIRIDPEQWERASTSQRLQLLFHELGHCVRGLDHDDDKREDGFPASIMQSYMFSRLEADYFAEHLEDYLQQLRGLPKYVIFSP
jgi:hypothetical protein